MLPQTCPGAKTPPRNRPALHSLYFKLSFRDVNRTRIGPEDKKKERPRGGRSHVNTGRDDKIWTCDPLLPKQVRYQAALHPVSVLSYAAGFLSYKWIDWQVFWSVRGTRFRKQRCLGFAFKANDSHTYKAGVVYCQKGNICYFFMEKLSQSRSSLGVATLKSWPHAGHLTFISSPPPIGAQADREATIKTADRRIISFFMVCLLFIWCCWG